MPPWVHRAGAHPYLYAWARRKAWAINRHKRRERIAKLLEEIKRNPAVYIGKHGKIVNMKKLGEACSIPSRTLSDYIKLASRDIECWLSESQEGYTVFQRTCREKMERLQAQAEKEIRRIKSQKG